MLTCLSPNGLMTHSGEGACRQVLVGTTEGIAVLEKDGDGWRRAGLLLEGHHISALLVVPGKRGLFAGVHRGRVHYSADDGRTWEERSAGITIDHIYTLACNMEDGLPVLYAGTEPVSLFRSTDYGKRWQERPLVGKVPGTEKWSFPMPPNIPHVKTLAFDPRDPLHILAGVEQGGLFRTRDGGGTWKEVESFHRAEDPIYKDMHQIVRRPNHPDELYLTTGMGLYASADDGETWTHLTDPKFRIGYPDKLVFSPQDDGLMFMCGAVDNPGTWRVRHFAHPAVMASRDSGRTWTAVTDGMPEDMVPSIEALSIYASSAGVELFAGTTAGEVYHSRDGAQRWQRVCEGLGPVSKSAHFRLLLPGGPGGPGATAVPQPRPA